MKLCTLITLLSSILLFPFVSTSQSQLSLLREPLSSPKATALIASVDGTIILMESVTGNIIWSFSTGSPIYHSYHAPINNPNPNPNNNNNSSTHHINGLIECGEDWELILHDTHFGKTRLPQSVADYVAVTPTVSEDGAVILGSKKSTVFEVDAKTGKLVRSYATLDLTSVNASSPAAVWSDGTVRGKKNSSELADPVQLSSPELLLKIIRTDYFLQSVGPGSGIVLWTMTVAEFQAVLLCQKNSEHASEIGLDFAMPYACGDRKLKEVFRLPKRFLSDPGSLERLYGAHQETDMLLMPTSSNPMLPLPPDVILPLPGPNALPSLPPKIDFYDSKDNAAQPVVQVTAPWEVEPSRIILSFALILVPLFVYYIVYRSLLVKNQVMLKDQHSEPNLKSSPAKKKRARKSGRNNSIVDKQDKLLSSAEEDILEHKQADSETWLHSNKIDGRRIGKLFVTNKEIAKGSNGTVVLEGMYEGREVAIKRLVHAHHDVAHKEIQNLIASDRHPNIVRWYGVEYDNDFVYLALERCACSLDDLIHFYSDISENRVFSKDPASEFSNKVQIDIERDDVQYLWKENGYPSPLLLKLMRDVVSGLVHLHELGIVHRDLKPHNVLIVKERSLCAKLSDMGISKRLLDDMTSLGHSATGCGSSGWQAPEQLVPGRQTRAVDLFSLGCVLFFCMTAGRHPFGERLERDVNIVKSQKDLFLVEFIPEAEDLISRLLNRDPDLRPKAIEVLQHPLFWSSEMKLSFLRDVSDRVELEDRETESDLLKALESIAPVALGGKWDEKLEQAFLDNIGRYRRYKFDSVRDMLRVLRNKLNHYRELPQEIQELVGPVPEGFHDYFASRFPRLLIEVYNFVCKYCKDDECFQRYFRDSH